MRKPTEPSPLVRVLETFERLAHSMENEAFEWQRSRGPRAADYFLSFNAG
jgi:hypothetical protein